MNTDILIRESIAFVKQTLDGAEGGHDWFHIERVYVEFTTLIAEEERCRLCLSYALGALFHDIADAKFHNGDESSWT